MNTTITPRAPGFFRFTVLFVLCCILLFSCQYTYKIHATPHDALILVDGQPVVPEDENTSNSNSITITASHRDYTPIETTAVLHDPFATNVISIDLVKKKYAMVIDCAPREYQISIDHGTAAAPPIHASLEHGAHSVTLVSGGKEVYSEAIEVTAAKRKVIYHPQSSYGTRFPFIDENKIRFLGSFPTGKQPKQVVFSPDSEYLYIPLLADEGFDVYHMPSLTYLKKIPAGASPSYLGFVEGLFLEHTNTFLVTQMTRSRIIEYSVQNPAEPVFSREINSKGNMPKVVAYSKKLDCIAVSNWMENSVVILDYATGNIKHVIPNLSVPRGVLFSPDERYLYIASYEGGFTVKFETASWKEVNRVSVPKTAMRHIVQTKNGKTLFVSDMMFSKIFEIDATSFSLSHTYSVFSLPNTIDLTPNDELLFVSCRGPNSPEGYLYPSVYPGKVLAIDVASRKIIGAIEGGRQPTGLDVSSDGKLLVFSNFQDADIDVYNIESLYSSTEK
ncbi:MAG: hypothetical protein JW904_13225 [Spirochaetales bacterium]|nr:hypothetical protein [Spirochaetales bacterium]